jgi:signal transduction histidine kinase/ligand-binding sensor domain-containing protein
MKGMPLLLLLLLLCVPCGAVQSQEDVTLHQLNHRAFKVTEGVPNDVHDLAQTTDGTLWIGGHNGLTRFDGIQFVSYPGPSDEPLQSTNIGSLMASPDGGLWIGFRLGGVDFLKNGHLTRYGNQDGLPEGTIEQFAWDRDGSLWAASRVGLFRFRGGRWERVTRESNHGTPYAVLVDKAGTVWLGTAAGLFARPAGEAEFRVVDRRVHFGAGRNSLATSPDGRLWGVGNHQIVRIDGMTRDEIIPIVGVSGGPVQFDASGNLWVVDVGVNSLWRVPRSELTVAGQHELIVHPEKISSLDSFSRGLSSAMLQDREHNIWVGTQGSLDRFSHSNVVQDIAPPCYESSNSAAAFGAGDDGVLWMTCSDLSGASLHEIRGGTIVSRQSAPVFSVVYRDAAGTVWFGGSTALGHLENGRLVNMPLPPQIQGRPLQALVRDREGAMWVSVSRRTLFRWFDGEWTEYGKLDALPRGYPIVETMDSSGALWFGYVNNQIARVNGRAVELFDLKRDADIGNVLAILASQGNVWIGGELGLARFDGKRFVAIRSASGAPFTGISGIVRAQDGDLWVNGAAGVVRIDRKEVDQLLRDPAHRVECELFNYLDGVPGTALQVHPQPSAVQTSDGIVWFSMTAGVISIDPTHLVRNARPPPLTIWSLTAGGKRYPIRGADLQLPVHTQQLQIDYTAGSLTVPERVHFKYRLEGSDSDWQDAGTRREALYTNLGPGAYAFQVIASNNDGVWNNTGAAIHFMIAPAFYQTRWFDAVCVLAVVALLAVLYQIRMRQVAAQARGRLEARLAERERIARELHDTLLQGIQGLIWRFQAATDRIPADAPARDLMEKSLDRADKLLAESRDRVKELRPTAAEVADLAQALAAEGDQFAQLYPIPFRVSVQGTRRGLHPIVREEGFLIAREALGNAFRHAQARDIEAEVTYGERALQVRVRDDGLGISPAVLQAGGRPGHFGLLGMRERAKKLGGHLDVWSKPGAGTEIDLRVPAQVAYRRAEAKATLRG